MSSSAQIIRKLLIDAEAAPDSRIDQWSPFVSFLPDKPDSAIVVYDTAGVHNGRLMRGGKKINHPGVMVRLRGPDYADVRSKSEMIADLLDSVSPGTLVLMSPTEEWMIKNISRTGDIIPMGMEDVGDRRRYNFTINAILTMRPVDLDEFAALFAVADSGPGFDELYDSDGKRLYAINDSFL